MLSQCVISQSLHCYRHRAGSVVSVCANVSCLLSVMLQPYMPATSATIQQQLQAPASVNVISGNFVAMLKPGHKIGKVICDMTGCLIVETHRIYFAWPSENFLSEIIVSVI